jgi:hypothetical protein
MTKSPSKGIELIEVYRQAVDRQQSHRGKIPRRRDAYRPHLVKRKVNQMLRVLTHLRNGATLEKAAAMANHASTRTM